MGGVLDFARIPLFDGLAKFRQCARAILYEKGRYFAQQLHIPAHAG
jgi:hypothetical protein